MSTLAGGGTNYPQPCAESQPPLPGLRKFPFSHMQICNGPKNQGGSLTTPAALSLGSSSSQYFSLQVIATVASPTANSARPRLFPSLNRSLETAATLSTFRQETQTCACHMSKSHNFIYILQLLAA